jgi:hypothetical protein
MMLEKHYVGSLRKGLPPPSLDTGAGPVSEMTVMASSPEDLQKYLEQQEELALQYAELFK